MVFRTLPLTSSDLTPVMSRLSDELMRGLGAQSPVFPRIDVALDESTGTATIWAEVPGVDPESLEIEVEQNRLTLRGEREALKPSDDSRTVRIERSSGAFERTLRLPFHPDVDSVEATTKHGVLRLELPRRNEERPRRISVRADS